ncbi:MAG: PEGA domain-containing protein, partial [Flavobacteriales bacterium]|nr:PEGA domain-containing protein [Flavobacteriales bacterium]
IYEVCFVKDQIALNVYKIFVSDENSKVIKKVEIRLTEKETQQQFGKYKSNRISGKLIIISEPNKEYEVEIEANGYETLKTQINLDKEQQLTFKLIKKDE